MQLSLMTMKEFPHLHTEIRTMLIHSSSTNHLSFAHEEPPGEPEDGGHR